MQSEIDFTWEHPTEAQQAALQLVRRLKPRQIKYAPPELGGFTELNAAECVCTILVPEGLVYIQASEWSLKPPTSFGPFKLSDTAQSAWRVACGFTVAVLDLGYDPETKQWWNLSKLESWRDPRLGTLILMDFGTMLRRCTEIRSDEDAIMALVSDAPPLVPASWWLFLDLVCGRDWEQRYAKFAAKLDAGRKAKR